MSTTHSQGRGGHDESPHLTWAGWLFPALDWGDWGVARLFSISTALRQILKQLTESGTGTWMGPLNVGQQFPSSVFFQKAALTKY